MNQDFIYELTVCTTDETEEQLGYFLHTFFWHLKSKLDHKKVTLDHVLYSARCPLRTLGMSLRLTEGDRSKAFTSPHVFLMRPH